MMGDLSVRLVLLLAGFILLKVDIVRTPALDVVLGVIIGLVAFRLCTRVENMGAWGIALWQSFVLCVLAPLAMYGGLVVVSASIPSEYMPREEWLFLIHPLFRGLVALVGLLFSFIILRMIYENERFVPASIWVYQQVWGEGEDDIEADDRRAKNLFVFIVPLFWWVGYIGHHTPGVLYTQAVWLAWCAPFVTLIVFLYWVGARWNNLTTWVGDIRESWSSARTRAGGGASAGGHIVSHGSSSLWMQILHFLADVLFHIRS